MSTSRHPDDVELLCHLDAELADLGAHEVGRHLKACSECSARLRALQHTSSDVSEVWAMIDRSCAASLPTRSHLREQIRVDVERRWARRAPIALALTAALLFLTVRYEAAQLRRSFTAERGALPVSSVTPGIANAVDRRELCGGARRSVQPIPTVLRLQVLRDYGMENVSQDEYELDYLITPELGGLTDRRNLWPEPYGLRSWNAHAKDALEHELPRLVCAGRLDLETAQREMAANWIEAYQKYLAAERPIQLHARLLLPQHPNGEY